MKKIYLSLFIGLSISVFASDGSTNSVMKEKAVVVENHQKVKFSDPVGPVNRYYFSLGSCGYVAEFYAFSEFQAVCMALAQDGRCAKANEMIMSKYFV